MTELNDQETKILASIVETAAKLNKVNKMLLLVYGKGLHDGEDSAREKEEAAV